MSEILLKWLTRRIGVVTDFDPIYFGAHAADGTLIARLLQSYGIITIEQVRMIKSSTLPALRLQNLCHLQAWLKFIGIEIEETVIQNIAAEKGTEAVRLFYELFLCLENKQSSYLVTQQRGREIYSALTSKFRTKNVSDTAFHDSGEVLNSLTAPLVNKIGLTEWYRDKQNTIKERIEATRKKFLYITEQLEGTKFNNLPEKQTKIQSRLSLEKEDVEYLSCDEQKEYKELTYTELVKMEAYGENLQQKKDYINKKDASNYVSSLKFFSKKRAAHKEFKSEMQRMILTELWASIEEQREKALNDMISLKLLKQSQYEKQITTKLYNVRNEKKLIIENKKKIDRMQLEKHEEDAIASFDKTANLIEDYEFEQRIDREMNIELHKKLYQEKMQMKLNMRLDICKDAVSDLVDLAICAADFQSVYNTKHIPERVWSDWRNLFLAALPLIPSPLPQLKELQNPLENLESFADDKKEYILNNYELDDYLNLLNSWSIEQCFPNQDNSMILPEKLTLLGYIIHRLLLLKYPLPPPPVPPDLPPTTHAVALIGLHDEQIISVLSKLLNFQGIQLIQLDSVINFCLDTYKQEAEVVDVNLITRTKSVTQEQPKIKTQVKKKAATKYSAKKNNENIEQSNETLVQEKSTQTPRSIQDDDEGLSNRAKLGMKAYQILSIGECIEDSLLMNMFVEYLKVNTHIKGWVLLNYPMRYCQAAQLEQQLLGIKLPLFEEDFETMENIENFEQREMKDDTSDDMLENFHESKFLPNPIPKPKYDSPKTYLTKYVLLKKNKTKPESTEENETVEIINTDEENVPPLEKFYVDQEISYTFYHDLFDFPTVKKLARFIIEDEHLSPAPSLELFGGDIKDIEERFATKEKKGTPPSSKKKQSSKKLSMAKIEETNKDTPEAEQIKLSEEEIILPLTKEDKKVKGKAKDKKEKGKGIAKENAKGKKVKEEIKNDMGEDKLTENGKTQIEKKASEGDVAITNPKISKDLLSNEQIINISESKQTEPPKPGDEGWEYINLEIPENVAVYLATLWENVEDIFIKDFKELTYGNHLHFYAINSYLNYVKHNIMAYIDRPDSKQLFLTDFLKIYNAVDNDLRDDFEMKNELHCKVSELQQKLWDICDQHKKESEYERQCIIKEGWIVNELTTLVNFFIGLSQLELDRTVDTLQIIHDYYISMLKGLPSIKVYEKNKLSRLELPVLEKNTKSSSSYSINSQQKTRNKSGSIIQGEGFKEFISQLLIGCDRNIMYNTPFHDFIRNVTKKNNNRIDNLITQCEEDLQIEDENLNPRDLGKSKKKKQKKENNDTTLLDDTEQKNLQALRDISPRLFQEWQQAISNEKDRIKFRLQLCQENTLNDLNAILYDSVEEFYNLREKISERYKNEVESVRILCNLLCKSIESEVPIQKELVLEKDKFYIEPNILLYPPPAKETPELIEEKIVEDRFSIAQLGQLMEKLKFVAPSGIISARAFVYILEDIIVCEPEAINLPKIWYQLKSDEITKVLERIYGYGEYLDWKDFLIYALEFKFPTMEELLIIREKFKDIDPHSSEVISHEIYINNHFIFVGDMPEDPHECLRVYMGLELLFTLFQVDDDKMNYSALLLYFCKDKSAKVGLAKAIAFCIGKTIFASYGEIYAQEIIEEIIARQKIELKKIAIAEGKHIVSQAIKNVFEIIDVPSVSTFSEESNEVVETDSGYINNEKSFTENIETVHNSDVLTNDEQNNLNITDKQPILSASNTDSITRNKNTSEKSILSDSNESIILDVSSFHGPSVTFDVLLTILSVCLPWHIKIPNLINERSLVKELEIVCMSLDKGDNTVYIHEFLEHPLVEKLLSIIYKFKTCDIAQEVRNVISSRHNDAE